MSKQKMSPFLSFDGKAEEAMKFYVSALPGAEISRLVRYGKDSPHMKPEESERVLHGAISYKGLELLFLDMSSQYPPPPFSWATSLYIDCESEAEFDKIFAALSSGGSVMMGPEAVGPIRKCAWVTDKFGVTWQPVWE